MMLPNGQVFGQMVIAFAHNLVDHNLNMFSFPFSRHCRSWPRTPKPSFAPRPIKRLSSPSSRKCLSCKRRRSPLSSSHNIAHSLTEDLYKICDNHHGICFFKLFCFFLKYFTRNTICCVKSSVHAYYPFPISETIAISPSEECCVLRLSKYSFIFMILSTIVHRF